MIYSVDNPRRDCSGFEGRDVASGGGGKGRAQRSGGPVIAYWPSGTPGHSIQIVGRTPKRRRPPRY